MIKRIIKEKNDSWWGLSLVIGMIAGVFLLFIFIIKFLWAWTIPDLFPGAVEQGLIAESISWLTSGKLALFALVLLGSGS